MKRTIRRLIGGLLLITALLVAYIPAKYIEASNAREDYLMDNNILVNYTGTASTVSVSDEVRIIGEEAFANNDYIISANLGKNVKEIRHGAFANCNGLNVVNIPNSVEIIEAAAFSGCNNLRTVSIGKNLEAIGDGVFAGCNNLAGISVSSKNNNFMFEAGVLYDDKKEKIYSYLTANPYEIYYMPNTVEQISPYSFWGNTDLEEVYLSSKLEAVPAYSFSNCKDLKVVQIPYSVDSIDAKAFENCISLTDIEIPASVTYIDPTAFDGCYNLNIIAAEGTAAYEFFQNFDKSDASISEMMDSVSIIRNSSDSNDSSTNYSNTSTNNGTIDASKDPSNVDWMPSVNPLISSDDSSVFGKTIIVNGQAVFFVNREMEINQLEKDDFINNSDNNTISVNENNSEKTDSNIYDSGKGGYLPKYTYINKRIASQAYYASNDSDDFTIPEGTIKIGRFAFARSSISSVMIPEGVEEIGYGAFYHCDSLSNVSIPSSVKKIDGYAFANTPFENSIKNNSTTDYYIVGDGILLAYSGKDHYIKIPDGVKTISSGCFENMTNIESVILPDSLICIESDAFRECTSLKAIVDGNNLEYINDRAFMGCPIENYKIPSSVKKIGLRAFDFSSTNMSPEKKAVSFEGSLIPLVSYDETSSRLNNVEYRKDALYNVLFAVVDDNVNSFEGTVLDNNTLGFSGIILTLEKDSSGNETGFALIKDSYIYSDEVFNAIPDKVVVNNNEYIIKNKNNISLAANPYNSVESSKTVIVNSNVNSSDFTAKFSEQEIAGSLNIVKDDTASIILNNAYANLFGGETINDLVSYNITLLDDKDIVKINRLGKTSLNISIPVDGASQKYHVITLDEDGQLEELNSIYNADDKTVTFTTNHLSYFGIYGNENDNVVLSLKDGKLIKEYRLDKSPNTGDNSLSVFYVISIALISLGLLIIVINPKKKVINGEK